MSARPTFFVFDLDGTALGGPHEPYARLPEEFCAWLDAFADDGGQWAINSTWGLDGQWKLVLGSPVRSRPAWLMAELGRNLARVTPRGPEPFEPYCGLMRARLAECEPRFAWARAALTEGIAMLKSNFYGHWFDFTPQPEHARRFAERVCERGADFVGEFRIEMRATDSRLIVHPRFLEKGLPLAAVLEHARLRPAQVLVAGDAAPDLAMMRPELARHLVCPGNAEPAVAARVRESDGRAGRSPASDGVLEALAELPSLAGVATRHKPG